MAYPFISYSEIKLARKCPKAWDYRYRQNLRRRRPKGRPAFIGTILHEMLDALVLVKRDGKYEDPWDVLARYEREYSKLWKEEKEEFGDVPSICEKIFEGYMRRWRGDGLVYEATEVEFIVPFVKGKKLRGYIDKILRDRSGRRFLMDHKFHRILPDPQARFSDIQTVLYFWGWNETHTRDERLDGIIWDYGRMKAPAIPELLKSGKGLTKRANIDTDVFTYRQAIRENGLDEKNYRDLLKKLAGKERTFFERVVLPAPSKHLIRSVVEDARGSAEIIRRFEKSPPRHMSGFNCSTCDYRSLCEAEVRGLDADFVRKKDYVIEKREGDKTDGTDEYEEAA